MQGIGGRHDGRIGHLQFQYQLFAGEALALQVAAFALERLVQAPQGVVLVENEHIDQVVGESDTERVEIQPRVPDFVRERPVDGAVAAAARLGQAGETETAVLEEGLPKAGDILRDHQQILGLQFQPRHDRRGDGGQRKHAGDRQIAGGDRVDPGGEQVGLGQGREQEAVFAPGALELLLRFGDRLRDRREIGGGSIELLQLALDQLAPVTAPGVWQRLDPVILVGAVDHDMHRGRAAGLEIPREPVQSRVVVGETGGGEELPVPARDRNPGRRYADQQPIRHRQNFILPIMS